MSIFKIQNKKITKKCVYYVADMPPTTIVTFVFIYIVCNLQLVVALKLLNWY